MNKKLALVKLMINCRSYVFTNDENGNKYELWPDDVDYILENNEIKDIETLASQFGRITFTNGRPSISVKVSDDVDFDEVLKYADTYLRGIPDDDPEIIRAQNLIKGSLVACGIIDKEEPVEVNRPVFFDDDGNPTNIKIFDTSDQYAKMTEWDDTYIESRMWDIMNAVKDPIEEAILLIKEWVRGEPGYKLAEWKEGVWPFNGYAIDGYVKYEDIEGAIRADIKTYIGYCDDRLDFQDILVRWDKETMKVELIYTNASGSIEYHKDFYIKGGE